MTLSVNILLAKQGWDTVMSVTLSLGIVAIIVALLAVFGLKIYLQRKKQDTISFGVNPNNDWFKKIIIYCYVLVIFACVVGGIICWILFFTSLASNL